MIRNYEWVDYVFVQSTAWFLGHDIIIVTTTSTEDHPFIRISGNLQNENSPCPGIELTIGSLSQVHYQSLLPITITMKKINIKTIVPANTINLRASYNPIPDLNSMSEFPDLEPRQENPKFQPCF